MDPPESPPPQLINPHFLVVSLGNPPPFADTLHSAGHIALQSLQHHLGPSEQPAFTSERIAKKATQTSRGPRYTLLQCPTLMNVSGPWVARAWREFHAEKSSQNPLGLVVVHDELESEMCVVKVRQWARSHRGHNGLKSIMGAISPAEFRGCKWAKVAVGIGRPEGRDHDTVSDYVLRPLSKFQRGVLVEKTAAPVLAALGEIEAEWRVQRENGTEGEDLTPQKPQPKPKKQRARR